MTRLATLVTNFASRVERAPVGGGAVTRNVALKPRLVALRLTGWGAFLFSSKENIPTSRKHNISWPGLGNREHSGWVHHTCSKLQSEDRRKTRRENPLHNYHDQQHHHAYSACSGSDRHAMAVRTSDGRQKAFDMAYSNMPRLSAGITATTRSTTAQAQGRAVSLDMT